MNKMSGLVFLVVGLALMAAAIINLFDMKGTEPGVTTMVSRDWSNPRMLLLSVGAVVGVFGCYALIRKTPKKD